MEELGISETLFKELEVQLDERGLVLKEGTLMDATLVKAHVRRPSTAGRGAKSPADPDADWTKTHRGRRTHFGYKVHLGVDAGTGLVRKAALTPAKVYESEVADGLVSGDERAVYGDRAYESKRRRRWLKSQGINDRIMHRSHKHQRELPHWQKRRNELISRRALVEKVFGTLKRSYGYSASATVIWGETRRDVVQADGLQPDGQTIQLPGLNPQRRGSCQDRPTRSRR